MSKRSVIVALLVAFTATAGKAQDDDLSEIYQAISAFSQAYMDADYERLASFYTEDGMILPPGPRIIQGRQAIQDRWTLPEGIKILHHAVTPETIEIFSDHAWDVGYYEGRTLTRDSSEVAWKGKYLIVWKKVDGEWLIHADAWNSVD